MLYVAPWILFHSNELKCWTEEKARKHVREKEISVIEAIRNTLPIIC